MGTRRYGATRPMECTSLAAGAAAASVSTASVTAERAAALHAFAQVSENSMTCIFSTARRREGGICRRCFWKNSSGGLMRSDDLT